jgi:hypothetical protein
MAAMMGVVLGQSPASATGPIQSTGTAPAAGEDLQVEVMKKGLGKEVVIRKGSKEWYMLIEVTESNSVVIRQEKDNDTYIVDESETHDHALSKGEVDSAIEDFINSVKTQTKQK